MPFSSGGQPPINLTEGDSGPATSGPQGAEYVRIANSSALTHPTGLGVGSTDAWQSEVVNEDWTDIEAVLLETLPAAQRTLQIRNAADTETLWSSLIPATFATFVPLRITVGVAIPGPWAVKLGGADYTAQILYRRASQRAPTRVAVEPADFLA